MSQKETRYHMRRMKSAVLFLGIGFMGLCFGTNGFAAQDIAIAFMVPLTGSGAFYGKVMRDVGRGIVDEINEVGVKGCPPLG